MADTVRLDTAQVELRLEVTRMVVAPGSTTRQKLTLVNLTSLIANFDLTLAGIPVDWYRFSQTNLNLFPNWSESVDLEINVPAETAPNQYHLRVIATTNNENTLRKSINLELEISEDASGTTSSSVGQDTPAYDQSDSGEIYNNYQTYQNYQPITTPVNSYPDEKPIPAWLFNTQPEPEPAPTPPPPIINPPVPPRQTTRISPNDLPAEYRPQATQRLSSQQIYQQPAPVQTPVQMQPQQPPAYQQPVINNGYQQTPVPAPVQPAPYQPPLVNNGYQQVQPPVQPQPTIYQPQGTQRLSAQPIYPQPQAPVPTQPMTYQQPLVNNGYQQPTGAVQYQAPAPVPPVQPLPEYQQLAPANYSYIAPATPYQIPVTPVQAPVSAPAQAAQMSAVSPTIEEPSHEPIHEQSHETANPALISPLVDASEEDMTDLGRIELAMLMSQLKLLPNETAEQNISLVNRGSIPDLFQLQVRGIPAAWYQLTQTSFNLFPNWSETTHFTVTIPSDSLPAVYPAQLVVNSGQEQLVALADFSVEVRNPVPIALTVVPPPPIIEHQQAPQAPYQPEPAPAAQSPVAQPPAPAPKPERKSLWQRLFGGGKKKKSAKNEPAQPVQPPLVYQLPSPVGMPPAAQPMTGDFATGQPIYIGDRPTTKLQPSAAVATGLGPVIPIRPVIVTNFSPAPQVVPLEQPLAPAPAEQADDLGEHINYIEEADFKPVESVVAPAHKDHSIVEEPEEIEAVPISTESVAELPDVLTAYTAQTPVAPVSPVVVPGTKTEGLSVEAEQPKLSVSAGGFAEQQISIINHSDTPGTFDITIKDMPEGWFKLSSESVYLFPNWKEELYLRVDVPTDAKLDQYKGSLLIASQEQPDELYQSIVLELQTLAKGAVKSQAIELELEEGEIGTVELAAEFTTISLEPGKASEQQIELTNATTEGDTFDLSIEGIPQDWYSFSCGSLTLFPGWGEEFYLRIQAPAYVASESHDFKIVATPRDTKNPAITLDMSLKIDAPLSIADLWRTTASEPEKPTPAKVAAEKGNAITDPSGTIYMPNLADGGLHPDIPMGYQEAPAERNSLAGVLPIAPATPKPERAAQPLPPPAPIPVYEPQPVMQQAQPVMAPPPAAPAKRSWWNRLVNPNEPVAQPPVAYDQTAQFAQTGQTPAVEYAPMAPAPAQSVSYAPPAGPATITGYDPNYYSNSGNYNQSTAPSNATPTGLEAYYNQPTNANATPTGLEAYYNQPGANDPQVVPAQQGVTDVNQLFRGAAAAPVQRRAAGPTTNVKVQIKLERPRITIIAGENSEQTIGLVNLTSLPDQFDISIEGLPTNWYKFSSSAVNLFPNWTESVQLGISLSTKVRPNMYIGKVIAVSQTQPGVRSEMPLEIEVLAPLTLEARLQPHRARGYKADYKVIVRNRSMSDGIMTFGLSPETQFCQAKFNPEKITIPAGHSQAIPFRIQLRPKTPDEQARQSQPFEVEIKPEWIIDNHPVKGPELIIEGQYNHESRWALLSRYPRLTIALSIILVFMLLWMIIIVPAIQGIFFTTADKYIYRGPITGNTIAIEEKAFTNTITQMNPIDAVIKVEFHFREEDQQIEMEIHWSFLNVNLVMKGKMSVDSTGNLIYTATDPPNPSAFPWILAQPDKMVAHLSKRIRLWISDQAPGTKIDKVEIEGSSLIIRLAPCSINDTACNVS